MNVSSRFIGTPKHIKNALFSVSVFAISVFYACSDSSIGTNGENDSTVNRIANPYAYLGDLHTGAMEAFKAKIADSGLSDPAYAQNIISSFTQQYLASNGFSSAEQITAVEAGINFTLNNFYSRMTNKSDDVDVEDPDFSAIVDALVDSLNLSDPHKDDLLLLVTTFETVYNPLDLEDSLGVYDTYIFNKYGEVEGYTELASSAIVAATFTYWKDNALSWFAAAYPDSNVTNLDIVNWSLVGKWDVHGAMSGMIGGAIGGAIGGGGVGAAPGAVGGAIGGAASGSLGSIVEQVWF